MRLFDNPSAGVFWAGVISIFIACSPHSDFEPQETALSEDWEIFSSRGLKMGGMEISTSPVQVDKIYRTEVPATVMATLVRNEVYPDIFYSDNLEYISQEPFKVPWWYRKTFRIDTRKSNEFYTLLFEGLNYKANVWLNGVKIASADTVEGCFRMFQFDITQAVRKGDNILAVEIIPPKWGDLTIGFVDWNPWPPDNNMGIWRPVKLLKSGPVALKHVFVKPSVNTETLQEASLRISAELMNQSMEEIQGKVKARIEGRMVEQDFKLGPQETQKIFFDPSEYQELTISNPRLWWPNNLGDPELYRMEMTVAVNEKVSDEKSVRFGIREVDQYFNENGHRGFMINGKKILIKGAGWVDDLFLDDPDEKVENQIRYVKHMNLNTIRLEGFWGKDQKLYDYADENGILVMVGWSCQWEWEGYCGREEDDYLAIRTPAEIRDHARAYQDQVEWLRNHPSVFLWVYGSDKLLVPDLEKKLNEFLTTEDSTRPILNSCGSAVSGITGPSGVKMNGPYSYVTPNYWYVDDRRGGAFGFNTETGPGVQPLPLESIKRMIPPDHRWPVDSIWMYHLGRNEFRTFRHWMKPFNERYGGAENVKEFAYKAQMANYEAVRPMFEAFEVNRPNATGVIQWMLNSAWPGMLWQLYDWYLMPNGAFYGTKNACRPLNIIYNYKDGDIYLSNEYYKNFNNLVAEIRVLNTTGMEIFKKKLDVSIGENKSVKIFDMPDLPGETTTYFLDLRLLNKESEMIGINFYWLSTRPDVLDFKNSEWFVTPNKSYADLTGINRLKKIEIDVGHEFIDEGDTIRVKSVVGNKTDQIAFFIRLSIEGKNSGMPVLPVFWDDNYFSLLPGEIREVSGYIFRKDLGGDEPVFSYQGWNVKSN